METYDHRRIRAENRLLKRLCRLSGKIDFGPFDLSLSNLHLHLPDFNRGVQHAHSVIEVHTIRHGRGNLSVGRNEYDFGPGQFTLTMPDQIHFWHALESPLIMHVWWIELPDWSDCTDTGEVAQLFRMWSKAKPGVYDLPNGFDSIFDAMLDELRTPKMGQKYLLEHYLQVLMLHLARGSFKSKAIEIESDQEPADSTEDQLVGVVDRYLQDNLARQIDLESVAKYVTMSKRNLTRRYKELTGVTIGDRLYQLRLAHAMLLLEHGGEPIKTVAHSCGMPDVSYFSKQFKRYFGCSPTEFREQNRV